MPDLFGHQQQEAGAKEYQGYWLAMVTAVSVQEGTQAYQEGEGDHAVFKDLVMNQVNPENRQACGSQGQDRTMDRAYD